MEQDVPARASIATSSQAPHVDPGVIQLRETEEPFHTGQFCGEPASSVHADGEQTVEQWGSLHLNQRDKNGDAYFAVPPW